MNSIEKNKDKVFFFKFNIKNIIKNIKNLLIRKILGLSCIYYFKQQSSIHNLLSTK